MADDKVSASSETSVKDDQSAPQTNAEIKNNVPFIIGVAGGTASGKTTVCNVIMSRLHDRRVVLINQDSFYHSLNDEQSANPQEHNFDHPDSFNMLLLLSCLETLKKGDPVNIPSYDYKIHKNSGPGRMDSFYHSLNDEQSANPQEHNFDHPDSFNMLLLLSCLETLKKGDPVNIPSYDYKIHKNSGPGRMVSPSDVIILEGILVLHDERVRDLMNIKIFVDSDSDVRLGRRIKRDTVERGRNIQYVLDQYHKHVKPSFEEFILPSKKHADIIIPRGADNDVAIDLIVQHIRTKLGQHDLCKIYQNLFLIPSTFQIRGMHTLIRDVKTRKHDFVFYADRLIRLVVEHGLGHLPFTEKQIITPTKSIYTGVVFCKRLCGVAVIRSGESMENALRACCKGIKIGKVLIQREGNGRQLIYEKLPKDIESRQVLLLDPVLASGDSAVEAISLLLSKGVSESNIIFLNLIAAPEGIHAVCRQYPRLKIVTSEIDAGLNEHSRVIPGMGEFGDRYFGTGGSETDPFVPKSKV